jgi:hypothetical protein
MTANTRVTVTGPFVASQLKIGVWWLDARDSTKPKILLRGAGADADAALDRGSISGLSLEWQREAVQVALRNPEGVRTFSVRSALLHEPLPRLYEGLPLAGFDAGARRFWRRVFMLMRIPGGRLLLRFIARRRGRSA